MVDAFFRIDKHFGGFRGVTREGALRELAVSGGIGLCGDCIVVGCCGANKDALGDADELLCSRHIPGSYFNHFVVFVDAVFFVKEGTDGATV